MKEKGIYFAKPEIYEKIRSIGGEWNDGKERPLVCLIKSSENEHLYWAIPMGMWSHRDQEAKDRIQGYLDKPEKDIKSCFYHLGRTTKKSIFFISDAIPITDKYIERVYLGYDRNHFIIKNDPLIGELDRKLKRILSYENSRKNYFRQHITSIKNSLLAELEEQQTSNDEAAVEKDDDNK
ncbi:TPA: hypothetical protein ACSQIM_002716 [Clostridium perfringens]|uniref:hypothetical protein n=1 Tax=Clostridium perfringens TaxID=1502 RepID=UPI001CCCCC57|nr:hypothetical protein [Clostridium perfringens]UBK45548.1 hypothetical protein KLF41_00005 [Clostridium perfringens]UBK54405.1 hypothetical protein KLF42_15040 [Clostridium perfringens]UBK83496.1 hypothetical protein KLF50_15115 [Clostridium perfringens]